MACKRLIACIKNAHRKHFGCLTQWIYAVSVTLPMPLTQRFMQCPATRNLPTNYNKHICLLVSVWKKSHYWLGGQLVGNQWQWQGRITDPILYGFWGDSEPNGDGEEKCLDTNADFTWNDHECNLTYQFTLCERVI